MPPWVSGSAALGALITAVSGAGTVILASQVWRIPGESWVGIQLRLLIAWPWLNRKGCVLPAVCSGVSHCSALLSGADLYVMTIRRASPSVMASGAPRIGSTAPTV